MADRRKPKAGEWSYVRKVGSVKIEVMESDREKSGRDDRCANKQIKSLLNMAAMSSIQLNGEYKTYYLRRLSEGKNKMSTLNIIRNKLVFRAFAVVKRGTPYVDVCRFAA